MFGYIFRLIFLIIIVIVLVLSIKTLLKNNSGFKTKVLHILSVCSCVVLIVLSFWSGDISTPKVNRNLSQGISIITENCLPDTKSTQIYNAYKFDCDGYYGTISVSKIDNEDKENLNKKHVPLKIQDGVSSGLCSYVVCDRDYYGLPNICVGTITLLQEDTRIFVKYIYKDKKEFVPIKFLTFTQYFYRETIDIEEIANSIDFNSLIVIDESSQQQSENDSKPLKK